MEPLSRLQLLLSDLFHLDTADLDFGMYRLYHIKRQEMEAFIQEQIPESVRRAFQAVEEDQKASLREDVETLAQRIRSEVDNDPIDSEGSVREEYRQTRFRTFREAIAQYETAREALQQAQATEAQQIEVFNQSMPFSGATMTRATLSPNAGMGCTRPMRSPMTGKKCICPGPTKTSTM